MNILKLLFIIIAILLFYVGSIAQLIPLYKFDVFFEDSMGNRDTVTLSYDERAKCGKLNSSFGDNR